MAKELKSKLIAEAKESIVRVICDTCDVLIYCVGTLLYFSDIIILNIQYVATIRSLCFIKLNIILLFFMF